MAKCIREEEATKFLLKWLITKGWEIVASDYPQSGTGKALHPNDTDDKTLGIIIPDIIAIKFYWGR